MNAPDTNIRRLCERKKITVLFALKQDEMTELSF